MFLYVKLFVEKYLFKLLRNYFLLLFTSKNFVFSVSFSVGFFLHVFPCLVFFCVLKNGFSFFITRLFLILLFNSVALFFSLLMYPKIRMCFLWWNVGKLSFVFCFCSLGLKNIFEGQNPFYFSTIFEISFKILFSLYFKPQKIQPKSLHFLFLFSPFFVSLFLSTFFPSSFITFFFVYFFLSSFCSSLFDFLSFFFNLFSILSFFLHLSASLSLFFLYLMFPHLFFFIADFVNLLLFYFIVLFSFCSWSHFSFHTTLPFFSSSPYLFFCPKKIKNLCVNFSRWTYFFVFWTLPSSVFHLLFFSSLRRPHSLFVPYFTDY